MIIVTEGRDHYLIVRLKGEFDMAVVPDFKKKVIQEMKEKNLKNLILNLEHVDFIDSTGIGAILGRYRYLQERGGEVILVGLNSRLERIFTLSGILKLLPVYDNEQAVFNKGGH